MEIRADFLELARRVGVDLADHVTARDDLYLRPAGLTRAAARRFRTGLKSLATYLRRLILLLALQMEHGLEERAPTPGRRTRRKWPSPRGFRVLQAGGLWPGDLQRGRDGPDRLLCGALTPSADLFADFDRLLALLKAPEARARRLASGAAGELCRHSRFRPDAQAAPCHGSASDLRGHGQSNPDGKRRAAAASGTGAPATAAPAACLKVLLSTAAACRRAACACAVLVRVPGHADLTRHPGQA